MKCLSVRQPWAHLIAAGKKTVETRSRPTSYRGPLAIHASLRDDYTGQAQLTWEFHHEGPAPEEAFDALPRGRIVAVAELVDCQPFHADHVAQAATPWRPDAWAWILRDVRRMDSVLPVRGQLGIWNLPDGILLEAKA